MRHTFTHFHLDLSVMVANVPQDTDPGAARFRAASDVAASDLPTVFAKALRAGLDALGPL